ncbi:MAG: asparagine synthase-related protein, partial [Exilibacterium sp.]
LGRRLFTVCMEAARLGHDSVWPVLFRAIKTGVFKLPAPRAASIYQLPSASFVRKEAVQSLDPKDFMHPFYLQPHRLPPAKASHVAGLLIPPLHLEQAHSDYFVNRIAPLCSQPLIELCLRIPTDVLTIGGKNRGLARRAFADLMPLEIATRESKSTSNSYQRNILSKQLPYARELLLEGLMVKEKLFDRKRLEQALTLDEKYDTSAFEHLAILRYMSTEIWLRSQLFD